MIYITEPNQDEILFQFFKKELPDDVTPARVTKMVNIQYNGGHQTNQVFGVFDEPMEWTGSMVGTYHMEGKVYTAKERLEQLKKLQGRPLRFGFPVPQKGDKIPGLSPVLAKSAKEYTVGDKGIYIIERITPRIKNHLNIEYTIRIVPHQRPEKIKPDETTKVKIEVSTATVQRNVGGINRTNATSPRPIPGANDVAGKQVNMEKSGPPKWDESEAAINEREGNVRIDPTRNKSNTPGML